MLKHKSRIKKILVIGLSNIGDSILMTPVLTVLNKEFPGAVIDLALGERAKPLFRRDSRIGSLITFESKRDLIRSLTGKKYDLVVDLRDSALGFLIKGKYTGYLQLLKRLLAVPRRMYMVTKHLNKLKGIVDLEPYQDLRPEVIISDEEKEKARRIFTELGVAEADKLIIVAPGARSHTKVWPEEHYRELIPRLRNELEAKVIICGDKEDKKIISEVIPDKIPGVFDLSGQLSLLELAAVMKRASLVITNDSGVLHIAVSSGAPTLSLFGPTDPLKYAPPGEKHKFLPGRMDCVPCEKALCKFQPRDVARCLEGIKVDEVFEAAKQSLRAELSLRARSEGASEAIP